MTVGGGIAVSSLYRNFEDLLAAQDVPDGPVRLGTRWCFAKRRAGDPPLSEYSLPGGPEPFADILRRRAALLLEAHSNDGDDGLRAHLESGRPAIVAVDVHELPHRPAYRRVHSTRTVVVRRGITPDCVAIVDHWPPVARVETAWSALRDARFPAAAATSELEPLFAGTAVDGAWWSLRADRDVTVERDWMTAALHRMVEEAMTAASGLGMAAMEEFVVACEGAFEPPHRPDALRDMALTLRSEISARAYLSMFLGAYARRCGDAAFTAMVAQHRRVVTRLQGARDLAAKATRKSRPEYGIAAAAAMREWVRCEANLLECAASLLVER